MNENSNVYLPFFATQEEEQGLPKQTIPENAMSPTLAKRMIEDYLLDEGNARMNLATFCQTYMEEEAKELMGNTLEKNAIDKSEYPKTAKIEQICIDMLLSLWNAPNTENGIGTSTVGSSEACMLAGMAMKFRWRHFAEDFGIDVTKKKPNLIITSGFQVCWEKFCTYWDIELREIPIHPQDLSLNIDKAIDAIDEYTIGIVGVLGITYTGKYDDIKALDDALETYNKDRFYQVVIHVDGASGAMVAPFIEPDLLWDFRLKNVVSISTSGHKYGLVYPGIGWVLWKAKEYLPKELIFEVSYLGGVMPTIAINFSRSASQIIAQYYTFVRYGFDGYKKIHSHTRDMAMYLSKELEKLGCFRIINTGDNLPIVCYTLIEDKNRTWDLFDLSDRLLMKGWQVPTYPLPADMLDVIIQRFVCRADLGRDMAEQLIEDIKTAIDYFNQRENKNATRTKNGYTH